MPTASELRVAKLEALLDEYKKTGKAKSVAALAKIYDIDTSFISQIRNGRSSFGENAARNLEEKLGLPHRYFEPDSELAASVNHDVSLNPYNLVKIPILDARAMCGSGAYNDDNPEILGFHEFPEEYLRSKGLPVNGDGVYIISSDGDSMAPTIPDKTPLLVNTKEKDFDSLITGKVYVFCANGSVVCKRVFINLDGTIVLRSDNTDKSTYPDQVVNRKVFDDFSVIGRLKTALVDF